MVVLERPKRQRTEVSYTAPDYSDSDSVTSDDESDDDPTDGGYVPLHEEEEESASDEDSDEDSDSDDSETDEAYEDDDVLEEVQSDELRRHIMRDQGFFYTDFNDLTHAKVLECLRFVYNASTFDDEYVPQIVVDDLDFIYKKLVEKYDVTQLSEIGGVPRAFTCQQYICKLFACLLLEKIPMVIKSKMKTLETLPVSITDPLSQVMNADPTKEEVWAEIEEHMNALDPVAYIRRCVGGAVAYVINHRDNIPEDYQYLFLPQRRNPEEGPQPKRYGPRVLGASLRTPMNDNPNVSRIKIQVYPTNGDPFYINTLMEKRVEYDTLLEKAMEKYEDVRHEMRGRQFTLLWSPYVYIGHHWNARDMPFVRIQEGFTHPNCVWDTRGICCAVESTEGLQIHSPDTSITLGGDTRIDVSNEEEAVEAITQHLVRNARDDWWNRKQGLTLKLQFEVQKTYKVYKGGNTKGSLEKRMKSLRRKVTLAVRCINKRFQRRFKSDFTNIRPQRFLHAFKTLKIDFDYDYL